MAYEEDISGILGLAGIPPGFFSDLINQSLQNNWDVNYLIWQIVQSNQFDQLFPGIKREDGSLKMSPTEYRTAVDSYTHLGQLYGYDLSASWIGSNLIGTNSSPQEFADRLESIDRINESPEMFSAFQQTLAANGQGNVGTDQLFDYMLGLAPKDFYDIWEETSVRGAAALSGFGAADKWGTVEVGALSNQEVADILANAPGQLTEQAVAQGFSQAAYELGSNMGSAALSSLFNQAGLSRSEILQAQFGGPLQAIAKQKIASAYANYQAYFEQQAYQPFVGTATGAQSVGGAKTSSTGGSQ